MNVLLKGHVTIHASIIQALLSVVVTKDTLSMASHIVEVSIKDTSVHVCQSAGAMLINISGGHVSKTQYSKFTLCLF